ncbi:hypothetical protein PSPO01_15041, partial [Paraphaeosphaeria sporulosa]
AEGGLDLREGANNKWSRKIEPWVEDDFRELSGPNRDSTAEEQLAWDVRLGWVDADTSRTCQAVPWAESCRAYFGERQHEIVLRGSSDRQGWGLSAVEDVFGPCVGCGRRVALIKSHQLQGDCTLTRTTCAVHRVPAPTAAKLIAALERSPHMQVSVLTTTKPLRTSPTPALPPHACMQPRAPPLAIILRGATL